MSSQSLPNDLLRRAARQMQNRIDKANIVPFRDSPPTRRRLQIQQSKTKEAEQLEGVQRALLKLADLLEQPGDPGVLSHVTTKGQVELILRGYWPKIDTEAIGMLRKCHITTEATFRMAHEQMKTLAAPAAESMKERQIRRAMAELFGKKIAGYFATPAALAADVVAWACLEDHHQVLEPSAGSGALVDAISERHPRVRLGLCEISGTLADILRLKGYRLRSGNFYDLTERYDRIIMNPPFEKLQDVEHVTVCYERLLKPGGRLVAIMSPAFTFRKEAKAQAFRELLEQLYVTPIENPEGSFKESGTNVRSVSVILNKPRED